MSGEEKVMHSFHTGALKHGSLGNLSGVLLSSVKNKMSEMIFLSVSCFV